MLHLKDFQYAFYGYFGILQFLLNVFTMICFEKKKEKELVFFEK